MQVQKVRLLETQYDVDTFNQNTIIIKGFYDYQTEEIFTPEQILEMEGQIALFVNLYNPVVKHFHDMCKARGYDMKTCGRKLANGGRKPTKNYRFFARYVSHRLDSQRNCFICEIVKPKTETQNVITIMDSAGWFRSDFGGFNVPTDGRAKQLCRILEYVLKENDGQMYRTLAAAARNKIRLNIDSVVDNEKSIRTDLVNRLRPAYASGYNYLRNNQRQQFLYYCDVNSMYVYCLAKFHYPSLLILPTKHEEYVPLAEDELAFYHIDTIVADVKPKHFPTLFAGVQMQKSMEIGDVSHLNIPFMKPGKGWITSVDYEMLLRDYDIKELVIDESLVYKKEKDISRELRAKQLIENYQNKVNAAKGTPEYDYYKMLLNTFTGSLSITHKATFSHEDLVDKGETKVLDSDDKIPNIEISAFMTAYARKYITELAYMVGYDKVHCISTDAVVVEDYTALQPLLGNNLGQLKMDELRHAKWWRVNAYEWYDENGKWKSKASGISDGTYTEGEDTACQPLLILNKDLGKYCKIYRTIKLSESIYEE